MTWGPFKEKRADEPRRCMILSHAADGEDLAMKNDIDSRREREDPQEYPCSARRPRIGSFQ